MVYDDLSIALFISGYLEVMDLEKPSLRQFMDSLLQELIADTELYGWKPVRAYHAIWLQQVENGQVN